MDNCLKPRPYGEHKGEPVEEYDANENWRDETHFPYPFYRKPSGSASFQTLTSLSLKNSTV
jgi:hypothetical protein